MLYPSKSRTMKLSVALPFSVSLTNHRSRNRLRSSVSLDSSLFDSWYARGMHIAGVYHLGIRAPDPRRAESSKFVLAICQWSLIHYRLSSCLRLRQRSRARHPPMEIDIPDRRRNDVCLGVCDLLLLSWRPTQCQDAIRVRKSGSSVADLKKPDRAQAL